MPITEMIAIDAVATLRVAASRTMYAHGKQIAKPTNTFVTNLARRRLSERGTNDATNPH